MIVLKVLPLLALATLSLFVALLVLFRGRRRLVNISFFALTMGVALWNAGIAAFLIANDPSLALVFAKVYYWAPLVISPALVLFAVSFPDMGYIRKSIVYVTVGSLVVLSYLLWFEQGFIIEYLEFHDWGKEVTLDALSYLAYSMYVLLGFLVAIPIFFIKSRTLKGVYRLQASLVFLGLLVAAPLGLWFNLILPGLGNYKQISVGPLATNFFLLTIGYSIIKHKMFDTRTFIARSIAYVLSLLAIACGYGIIVFVMISELVGIDLSASTKVFVSASSALAAISFPYVKGFFDKATIKAFNPDSYEAQSFIDELNKALLSNVDVETLSKSAANVIEKNLKVDHVAIVLSATAYEKQRLIVNSAPSSGTTHFDYDRVADIGSTIDQKVLVANDLLDSDAAIRTILLEGKIGVMAKLSPMVETGTQSVGLLILGNKRSGNAFNKGDVDIIGIISSELVIAIQNALRFEEIEKFNVTLQQKVDDATRKLRKTNERLKALDESKDEFISMASHQLRTPLTSVKGYISMVLEGDVGEINDGQRKMLTQAFVSSQRMASLIADLLNVSRLRTGKFVIEPSAVDLSKLVDDEISQLKETAVGRGLTLEFKKPTSFPVLMLDETKTRQVVMNFVDNAIYYTPSGGEIEVLLRSGEKSVDFVVRDNGIGVPKTEQLHLFTKFFRAGNARKARPDGTGLGLFMAKKVIVAQGGAVTFKSTEGKGSEFGFTFPLNKVIAK